METETLIVGAGPAGLATGACLRRAGRDFVIVDGANAVGSSWRGHYERLHLHTARSHSSLPHHAMPRDWPTYVPRARFVEYLEDYARTFEIAPRLGERVTRAEPLDGKGWRVTTSAGEHQARHLVVASGNTAVPHRPEFPGQARFGGQIVHSADFRNADPYRGKRVLVVGAGNTGAELALELSEKGAASVDLCIRGKIHVITRDAFGLPTQVMAALTLWIPLPLRDVIFRGLMRMLVGNLTRWGINAPAEGILAQIVKLGRVPLIDIGTIAAIREKRITVRGDIKELTEKGARFVDGSEGTYDSIVLATGFRPKLDAFIARAGEVLDDRGYPRLRGRETELPGLYFVGFNLGEAGHLRQIGIEARRVAAAIARRAS
jgi:thioredoxin reductase